MTRVVAVELAVAIDGEEDPALPSRARRCRELRKLDLRKARKILVTGRDDELLGCVHRSLLARSDGVVRGEPSETNGDVLPRRHGREERKQTLPLKRRVARHGPGCDNKRQERAAYGWLGRDNA